MSNQGGVQQAIRDYLTTELGTYTGVDYNGDWHALFDYASIDAGPFNGRLLDWINAEMTASYTSLPEAMQAYAEDQGFNNWSSMNTLTL